jgi:ribonuclease E
MASPDEARVDEAREQSSVPDSASTSTSTVPTGDEPASPAPQRRPRGAASFPGGPPPASAAPADAPVLPPPATEPVAPPQFRVTTVESAGASFPGGPPPPALPPSDDPAPPVATAARTEAPAEPPSAPAPREPSAPERPEGQAEGDGGGAVAAGDGPAGDGPAARTGGRRRRRGGRGRGATDPAAAADPAAADEVAGADPGPPDAEGAAPGRTPPDAAEPAAGEDEAASTAGGSARTRARRRRRAAAKARVRQPDGDAQTDAAGAAGGETATLTGPAAATGPAAPAEAEPTRRSRSSATAGGATGRSSRAATAQSDPGTATPDAPAGDQAPAPSRPSRSRRRGGTGNGEAQQVRTGNGEAEPAVGDPQAADGARTRAAGERGSGRRRRGRGGRLAAVDADVAAAGPDGDDADKDKAEGRDEGAGRGRGAGSERSTRLETRSRREGARQADKGRRRRPSGLTEEQKRILREEGPERRMVVTEGAERTQIGVLEGPTLVEHYVTRKSGRSMVGNVYLGRVQNVLPGMEAAFVDIGRGRNAVLYAGEVNYNEEDLDGEAPRIEKVLKAGQPVLVQVTKDPIGAKGARLTAQVSLAGRYLVLQPEDNTFGISRRLPETERSRLRDILKEVRPKGLGLIVRTAAEGASADDLRADLARLQARWETVERKAKKASAPAVIYSEPELVVRVIRDIFSPDFVELVVDGDDLYQRVEEYLTEVAPDLLPKLHKHQGKLPVFEHYRVVEQIHKALERKVWLPSGGSIVIDRTEAMTVIDVNTGKFVGKANLEETVVANNLEAADEIVRQLRLRDIGGIIIIDFIDMLFERNQQAVVDRLRAALVRDKTKSQVMEVSSLGLVQMTRKRVSGGLLDSFSETCPTCDGRGVVITHEIQ